MTIFSNEKWKKHFPIITLKIILDKFIILCYNVFEIKGSNIKLLIKNEKIKEKLL